MALKRTATRYVEAHPPGIYRGDESVRVLTLGEAAARLGLSRPELETLIAAGGVDVLPLKHTRAIPVAEVERLLGCGLGGVAFDQAD